MAVRVRQLAPIGTHLDETGEFLPNQAGDEYDIDDRYLNPDYVDLGGPATVGQLVRAYVDAGYVEVVE